MSTFRNPVGPQSAKVYWRRRLLLALVLIAVIVAIVLIVVRPGGGTPAPAPTTPPPSAAGTTGSNPPTTPGAVDPATVEACDPTRVTVEPTTDADTYDPGVNPVLTFALTSRMTAPCSFSAGSDLQEFRITSGEELIWSSKDCQTDPQPATVVLNPGVPFAGPSITWDRTRSSADTCDAERSPVVAEGASYHLEVKIGDVTSASTKQFLLY